METTPTTSDSAAAPEVQPPEPFPVVRTLVLLAVLIGVAGAVYLSPLRQYVTHVQQLGEQMRAAGWWAPAAFMLVVAALVTIGVPRLPLCSIGGMVLGFTKGLLWTQAGTLMGYYLVFLFVRWGGRGIVLAISPRLERWASGLCRRGIPTVLIARQLPIHGALVNITLGLSPVRHRDFLLGTAIGLFPEAIPCTLIGSGAIQASFARSATYMTIAVLILAAGWIGFGLYMRSQKGAVSRPGSPASPPDEEPAGG